MATITTSEARAPGLPAGATASHVLEAGGSESVVLPADVPLSDCEFVRSGDNLVVTAPDGTVTVVRGYFETEQPPALVSAGGGELSGDLVSQLAGPLAPGQYAQAAPAPGTQPIGVIETLQGRVTVVRTDGTRATLQAGDPVFQGDVLETASDGAVGIVLADDSTFSMAQSGRMVLDEMVYDPSTQSGSINLSIVQGIFTFVSGQVAKTDPDAMTITTPVATIGIRGTQVGIEIPDGQAMRVVLMEEADGFVGEVVVRNPSGIEVINGAHDFTMVSSFNAPPAPVSPMPVADIVRTFGSSLGALPTGGNAGANSYSVPPITPEGDDQDETGPDDETDLEPAGEEGGDEGAEEGTSGQEGDVDVGSVGDDVVAGGFDTGSLKVTGDFDSLAGGGGDEGDDEGDSDDEGDGEGEGDGEDEGDGNGDGGGGGSGGSTPVNVAPDALDMSAQTVEDVMLQGQLSASDFNNDSLTFTLAEDGAPAHGTAAINPDGSYTYTPDADYAGPDSFTYQVSDGQGGVDTATVTITVTDDDVHVVGTEGDDVLAGGAGDDTIEGLGGDDRLDGGAADDTLDGGSGDDVLLGGVGDDILLGGVGDDILEGDAGDDALFGGSGDDTLAGGAGDDALDGGEGDDTAVFAGSYADYAISRDGDSVLVSGPDGADTLTDVETLRFDDGSVAVETLGLPPVVTVAAGPAVEDEPIALAITASVPNAMEGIASLTIGGIPDGATLSVGTDSGLILTGNVLTGSGPNGTFTAADLSALASGTALSLTPPADFNDTIELEVAATSTDGVSTPETAAVAIDVTSVADVPASVSGSGLGDEDAAIRLTIAVAMASETTETLDYVTITGVPAGAVLSVGTDALTANEDGSFTVAAADLDELFITPPPNADGTIDLGVTATSTDGGTTAQVTVPVTVTPLNDAPVAETATAETVEDVVLEGQLSASDVDGDTLTFALVEAGAPAHGTVTVNPDGSYTYVPAADYHGPDSFTYQVSDGHGGVATAVISLTVTPVGDAAEVALGSPAAGGEDTAIALDLSASVPDSTEDVASITISGIPAGASLSVGTDTGGGVWTISGDQLAQLADLTITPPTDDHSDFVLHVSATSTDGTTGETLDVPVSVAAVADTTLSTAAVSGAEDTAIALSITPSLAGGETISAITISGVPAGALLSAGTSNGDGTWSLSAEDLAGLTITPPANSEADFTLGVEVSISDADATHTLTDTLAVAVTAVNDAPVAGEPIAWSMAEDGTLTFTAAQLLANATDVDTGDTLGVVNLEADGGTLTTNGDGSWTFTPAADFNGTVNLSYGISDGTTITPAAATVAVTAVDDVPAVSGAGGGDEDTAIELAIDASVPNSTETIASITISGVPDGAVLSVGADSGLILTGNVLTGSGVGGAFTDADLLALAEGALKVTPAANSHADFDLTIAAVSTDGGRSEATLPVSVSAVNDAPETADTTATTVEDAALTGQLAATDVEGDDLTFALAESGAPAHGSVVVGTDGRYTYTPDPDYHGEDRFTYTVSDGHGGTATATVTIAIANDDLHLVGTQADEVLTGGAGDDFIDGRGGDDTLSGGAGDDTLKGGTGEDILIGGLGDDVLKGEEGDDQLDGGAGDDTLQGGTGEDILVGGEGNDLLKGEGGDDQLDGGAGDDTLQGGTGDDIVLGGAGDDELTGEGGDDTLDGGAGNDVLEGGTGDDTLIGGLGDDVLDGGAGDDTAVFAGSYADYTITRVDGLIVVSGPDGTDTLDKVETLRFDDGSVQAATLGVAPVVSVETAAGAEDQQDIALTISASVPNALEGIASITITVPEGATLSAGTDGGNGVWTLAPHQLDGLTLTPPDDFNGTLDLWVTATSTSRATEAATSTPAALAVAVSAVPDVPTVSVSAASGAEDTDLTLTISASVPDSTESVASVTIDGVPADATLSAGTANDDGTWTLTAAQLSGLALRPAADYNGTFDLSVTATSTDGGTSAPATLSVDVLPVPETVDLHFRVSNGNTMAPDWAIDSTDGADLPAPGSFGETEVFQFGGHDIRYSYADADTATVSLTDAWNSVKNIEAISTQSADVVLQDFVHTDVTLGDGGDSTVVIDGAKRGTIVTGGGADTIDVDAMTNYDGWSNLFDIRAGAGDDTVTVTGDKGFTEVIVDGGAGNDRITVDGAYDWASIAGGAGDDVLIGGVGGDVLAGGVGSDRLDGGAGDDVLHYSADAAWSGGSAKNVGSPDEAGTGETVNLAGYNRSTDVFVGGGGEDTLELTDGDDALFLDDRLTDSPTEGPRLSGIETINAGDGNDIVDLTSDRYAVGDTTIDGGAGNDVLWASAGDDTLMGGIGDDRLYGGAGDDVLDGGTGSDTLDGGSGADILKGGSGDDTLKGGAGTDVAVFAGSFAAYAVSIDHATGIITVAGPDGTDTLVGIETLRFDDGDIAADTIGDPPTVEIEAVRGDEDAPIQLAISVAVSNPFDPIGAITLSGIPTGATLAVGTDSGLTLTGTVLTGSGEGGQFTTADLAALAAGAVALTPPADSDADFSVTVTVATASGVAAEAVPVSVTVDAVADAPSLSVTVGEGDDSGGAGLGTVYPLIISAALADVDGSEILGLVISGVPAGASLSAGTDGGGGTWTLTAGQLDGLTLAVPDTVDQDFSLSVSVTSTEGAGGDTATVTVTVPFNDIVNDAPVLTGDGTASVIDGWASITTADLNLIDEESGAEDLIYTLTEEASFGTLWLSDGTGQKTELTLGGTFTQADIDMGLLSYELNDAFVHAWDPDTPDWGTASGPVDQGNLTMPLEAEGVTVTFHGEAASYHNALGWYRLVDGQPQEPQIIWVDASEPGEGGDLAQGTTATLEGLAAGQPFGFFIIQKGANDYPWLSGQLESANTLRFSADGGLEFVNPDGTVVANKTISAGDLFFTEASRNPDGLNHAISGIQDDELLIGFEDMTNGGDNDFDDVVFSVRYEGSAGPGTATHDSFTFTAEDGGGAPMADQVEPGQGYTVTDGEATFDVTLDPSST